MFDLTGRTALVTGATGGIGAGIARALHGAGATIAISGTRAAVLEELKAALGGRVHVLPDGRGSGCRSRCSARRGRNNPRGWVVRDRSRTMLMLEEIEARRDLIDAEPDLSRLRNHLHQRTRRVHAARPALPKIKGMLTADGGKHPLDLQIGRAHV